MVVSDFKAGSRVKVVKWADEEKVKEYVGRDGTVMEQPAPKRGGEWSYVKVLLDGSTEELLCEVDELLVLAGGESLPDWQWMHIDKLAHSIAYVSCCSVIESNCLGSGDGYFDPANVSEGAEDEVAEAIGYLERRGLIEHDAAFPGLIRLKDESEASA